MQIGVVVELDEGLERDPEAAAIVQDRVMVIGNAPWPRIEIKAGVELALLRCAAELGVDVAAPERPVPSARTRVIFKHAHFVAGALKLDRRGHSGEAGPQNDDRRALGVAIEFDRTPVRRFLGVSEASHRLIGGRSADARANDLKQSSPAKSRRRRRSSISPCSHRGMIVASSNEAAQNGESSALTTACRTRPERPRAAWRGPAQDPPPPRCRRSMRAAARPAARRRR